MLYSKRRKNLGLGGRRKRSNRKLNCSNRLRKSIMRGGDPEFDELVKGKFYNLFIWIVANHDLKSRQDVSGIMENINKQICIIKNTNQDRPLLDKERAQEIIKNYIIANAKPKTYLSAIQVMLPTYKPSEKETISSNLVKAYNEAIANQSTWWKNKETVEALELPIIYYSGQ